MEQITPYQSKQVTAKLSDADYSKLVELYNRFYPETPDISFKEFFSKLLNNTSSDNDQLQEEFTTQLEALRHKLEECAVENIAYRDENNSLTFENVELKRKLEHAINAVETKSVIPADHILVHITPDMDYFLTKCAEQATRMMKQEITRAKILEHLFFEQIYSGPGDHLPLIFSKSEIRRVIEEYKKQQAKQE